MMKARRKTPLFMAILVLTIAFGAGAIRRSIAPILGVVRASMGRSIVVSESHIDAGDILAQQVFTKRIRLHNYSSQPVRILGNSATCSCISISHVDEMQPGESVDIQLTIAPPARMEEFIQIVYLFTDLPDYERLSISLTGRVVPEL